MRTSSIETPSIEELKCLIQWPEGTVGYQEELAIVNRLLSMCEQFGFGRVPQLAAQIEDIWRNPDKVAEYQALKEREAKWMEEARKEIER